MTSQLAERIAKHARSDASPTRPAVDEGPGCAFGAVTRQQVRDLSEVVGRIETKVNAVLGSVLVAVLLEVARGWLR